MKRNDITHGTTNVFADLGLPEAAERQTKTRSVRPKWPNYQEHAEAELRFRQG